MHRINSTTFAALLLLLGLSAPAAAAENLAGTVTEADPSSIKVEVVGELAPSANDAATIFFKPLGSEEEVLA